MEYYADPQELFTGSVVANGRHASVMMSSMVQMPSLRGSWAKVERAKEHRDALDALIKETFAIEYNRPQLSTRYDHDSQEYVLYVSSMPELTAFFERVSLMLGDATHNLRSSLDYLVYQLALLHTSGAIAKPRRLQFPITDSQANWRDQLRQKRLNEIDPAHIVIMERYQAYHSLDERVSVGGYFHPLAMLRDLEDTDKHQLLPTVMVPSTGAELSDFSSLPLMLFGSIQQTLQSGPITARPVELGTEITRMRAPVGTLSIPMGAAGYAAAQVAFPDGRGVIATIDKIARSVVAVIREFEQFF